MPPQQQEQATPDVDYHSSTSDEEAIISYYSIASMNKSISNEEFGITRESPSPSASSQLSVKYSGLFLIFLTPALGGFLYGFDIGATSFVLSMMLSEEQPQQSLLGVVPWWTQMTQMQQGLFVSALSLGAMLGSHLVWQVLCRDTCSQQSYFALGRRMELRIASYLYVIGTLLTVTFGTWSHIVNVPLVSPMISASHWNLGFLLVWIGRLLYGVGVGLVMHGAPAYMAEMCPPQYRGAMVSAKETVIVGGIVVGYAVGSIVADTANPSWSHIYALTLWLSLPMVMLTHYIPRSKRWLLQQGEFDEAKTSMEFLYHGNVTLAFDELKSSVLAASATTTASSSTTDNQDPPSSPSETIKVLFTSPNYRSAMVASMGLIIFQQFSGQPSVLSYATMLFQATGWSGHASVVTAVLMMCISTITVALVDRVGRKKLLLACCAVMSTALLALAICFSNWSAYSSNELGDVQKLVVLVAMFLYIGGYQLGFGPITWTIVSEIFPLDIKGPAIALGVQVNYGLNFLVQFAFPSVLQTLGWSNTFLLFASCLTVCSVFIVYHVPETTGLTLEEITEKLQHKTASDRASSSSVVLSEDSPLLPRQTPVLGALPNLEEVESQILSNSAPRPVLLHH